MAVTSTNPGPELVNCEEVCVVAAVRGCCHGGKSGVQSDGGHCCCKQSLQRTKESIVIRTES